MPAVKNTAKSGTSGKVGKNNARPRSTQKCTDMSAATNYRAQVLREITNNLSRIHDILLSEYQIRDINDLINKLLRERRSWEYRIKELGGPDYLKLSHLDNTKDSFTIKGYRYFGRARELPDVVKLLEESKKEKSDLKSERRSANSLKSFLNANNWPKNDYYFRYKQAGKLLSDVEKGNVEHIQPCKLEKQSHGIIRLKFSDYKNINNRVEVEKFLLQQKKKLLLEKIRANSKK